MGIAIAVSKIFDLINLLLFISIILTWIPTINWYNEPFRSLKMFSEIFFAPFRRIIPPIGMLDLSPIAALFALAILRNVVVRLLLTLGL